jgi:hypothetical protein
LVGHGSVQGRLLFFPFIIDYLSHLRQDCEVVLSLASKFRVNG